jgi:hypothetical protein
VDILIKRNDRAPATVMTMAIAVGKKPRNIFESFSWKISDFAKDPKSRGDIRDPRIRYEAEAELKLIKTAQ